MTCSCKDNTSVRSDADLNPAQEQYLIDLLNRDYSEAGERTDAGQMKCKVGKPCNGRCIPQNHKCGAPGGVRSAMSGGMSRGLAAGVTGLALAGGAAVAHGQVQKAGGYGAVGRNVANSGLNAAEGAIKGANNAVQRGASAAERGIDKIHGSVEKAAEPRSQRSEPVLQSVRTANTTAALSALNGTEAARQASKNSATKGRAFVRSVRKKVNG